MVTYFLSDEEVRAYLRDFLLRLERLDPVPTVWCPVTLSGVALLEKMIPLMEKYHPELAKKISTIGVSVKNKKAKFETKFPGQEIANKCVLLFDSSMHTGGTMRRCVAEALKLGASNVATYSLVIKRGSCFIPTFWGVTIDDADRIYFLLDKIPNYRLDSGPEKLLKNEDRKILCVRIEKLCEDHLEKPKVKCGVDSIDRVTWEDRHFNMQASENKECTYVLQTKNDVVGHLSVNFPDPACLFITEIAVDKKYQSRGHGRQRRKGKGYGAILMRFADTLARQSGCKWVRLNAIEERINWYKGFGYKLSYPNRKPIVLHKEKYYPMEHKVVYLARKLPR